MLNLEACDPSKHIITITPTIPVRRTHRGLPKITFYTPPEVEVLKSSCEIELLEGIKPVTVAVTGACKQGGVIRTGLKSIVPSIFFTNSRFWHSSLVSLPTIWVCMLVVNCMCRITLMKAQPKRSQIDKCKIAKKTIHLHTCFKSFVILCFILCSS